MEQTANSWSRNSDCDVDGNSEKGNMLAGKKKMIKHVKLTLDLAFL